MRVAEMAILTCDYCGDTFERYRWRKSKTVFCCDQCRKLYNGTVKRTIAARKPKVTLTCDYCGKSFTKWPSTVHKHNYCSLECIHAAQREGLQKSDSTLTSKHMTLLNQELNPTRMTPEVRQKLRLARMKDNGELLKDTYRKYYGRHMHVVVAERMLGRKLSPDEVVHHKDHDKHNNAPDNLEVLTRSEHAKLHARERKKVSQ